MSNEKSSADTAAKVARLFLGTDQSRQLTAKQTQWLARMCSKEMGNTCRVGVNAALTYIDGERMNQYELRRWPNGTAILAEARHECGACG